VPVGTFSLSLPSYVSFLSLPPFLFFLPVAFPPFLLCPFTVPASPPPDSASDHGHKSRGGTRGTSPPEFGVGDASANCPPRIFVI